MPLQQYRFEIKGLQRRLSAPRVKRETRMLPIGGRCL